MPPPRAGMLLTSAPVPSPPMWPPSGSYGTSTWSGDTTKGTCDESGDRCYIKKGCRSATTTPSPFAPPPWNTCDQFLPVRKPCARKRTCDRYHTMQNPKLSIDSYRLLGSTQVGSLWRGCSWHACMQVPSQPNQAYCTGESNGLLRGSVVLLVYSRNWRVCIIAQLAWVFLYAEQFVTGLCTLPHTTLAAPSAHLCPADYCCLLHAQLPVLASTQRQPCAWAAMLYRESAQTKRST